MVTNENSGERKNEASRRESGSEGVLLLRPPSFSPRSTGPVVVVRLHQLRAWNRLWLSGLRDRVTPRVMPAGFLYTPGRASHGEVWILTPSACCLIFSVSILVVACSKDRSALCCSSSLSFNLFTSSLSSTFWAYIENYSDKTIKIISCNTTQKTRLGYVTLLETNNQVSFEDQKPGGNHKKSTRYTYRHI